MKDDGIQPTHRAALILLLSCVAFAAFAFGGTELWAREWLRFGAVACLGLVLWSRPRLGAFPAPARALALPAMALVLLGLIQILPLPRSVLRIVSPSTAGLYESTVPAPGSADLESWLLERAADYGKQVAPEADGPDWSTPAGAGLGGRTLTIYPHATVRALLNWVTALILFLVTAALARNRVLRYRMLWGIGLLTGAMGLVAIAQRISWNGMILWFRPRPPGSHPLGPFVNPTHLAGFVEMGALVALGLGLALIAQHGRRLDLRTLRAAVMDQSWTLPRVILIGSISLMAVMGLIIAESRGGYLAFVAGILFLIVARRSRAVLVVLLATVAVFGAAAGMLTWIGSDSTDLEGVPFALSSADPSGALRLNAWGSTLRIFSDYPATGTGLGTFRWVYPAYQRIGEWKEWHQAHNDYVQFLAETGIAGGLVLLWGFVAFVRSLLIPALGREGGKASWTSHAVASAVFAMLVHTVFDFNLQIPANAAFFAVLLGVLAGAACEADRRRKVSHES